MADAHQPPSRSPHGPMSEDDLVAFFTSSVGEEKAREVVHVAISRLRLTHKPQLDRVDALAVLDDLAASDPGIVGVAARFAKARTLLRRF